MGFSEERVWVAVYRTWLNVLNFRWCPLAINDGSEAENTV